MNEFTGSASAWRKSTYSVTGECVEVGRRAQASVTVRDSKDAVGLQLAFTDSQWREFVKVIKVESR